jgi:hypothetical protein
VTGWKALTAALVGITALAVPSALALAHPDRARAASLPGRISRAQHELRRARYRLRDDRRAYAAALAALSAPPSDVAASPTPTTSPTTGASPSADPSTSPSADPSAAPIPAPSAAPAPSLSQLGHAVARDERRVRALTVLVRALRHELWLRVAAARGDWMPMVRDAARHDHISAVGLRRLMSLESGGRVHAENGPYQGLYQYCWSTWRAAWNPWRHCSIYSGEAQIRATALAIHRGWGPQMWPNTYPRAF